MGIENFISEILLTRHCPAHRHTPPSCFLLVIPCFLIWIFKCFDEQSKLLNLRSSCSSNKGWECLLQDSSNHISFQAMNRVSLLSLSFGEMKFLDFLANEIFCHRRSWWFLFLAFLWYPCRSFSRLWLFYNGWCFLNNFCFGYLGIHGQWISKLMFIPFVLHVFDKMPNVKTLSIFKEFGFIPSWNLFISMRKA